MCYPDVVRCVHLFYNSLNDSHIDTSLHTPHLHVTDMLICPHRWIHTGAFIVVNSATLDIVFEDRVAKKFITDIKCHAGGEGAQGMFAVLSCDGKVSLHELDGYRTLRIIR